MIRIQSVKKRAFLRQICLGALSGAATVSEAILATQSAVNSASFRSGKIIVSTSGNGQSASFPINYSGAEWTQENIFALCEEFLMLLQQEIAAGTVTDTSPNAMVTFETMADQIDAGNIPTSGVRQQMGDWSGLNIPSMGGIRI